MTVHINQPHGSVMPIKFSPCATNPCVATPNRGHVPTEPCTTTNRAARPSESCKKNIRAEPCARPSRRHEPPGRAYARALGNALGLAYARHAHSAVHTPDTRARLWRSAMHTPNTRTRPWRSAVHKLDTRTRPCIRPSTPTVLPKSPWTFCAPHSHI